METFEIHITGTPNIIDVLKKQGVKSLHAEMRNPFNETVGVEYMSSFIKPFEKYEECKKWVDSFVRILELDSVDIFRVKIECPYFYKHYREQAVYLESHFPKTAFTDKYPFVYNVNSNKYVCTDRVLLKSEYEDFITKWRDKHHAEIEFCLFDDNLRHDNVWVNSFNTSRRM